MNKKYLHRVIDQLVSETRIDYNEKKIYFLSLPFLHLPPTHPHFISSFFSALSHDPIEPFPQHCIDVYGLTEDEVLYIWKKYMKILKDKIENQKG